MPGEIVVLPDPVLLQASKPIKEITPKVRKIAEEMLDFLDNHTSDNNRPIGLSACQLGHPIKMIAFRNNPQLLDRSNIVILLNPEMVYCKGQHLVKESCLSIPGKKYQLKRFKLVKIRGTTLENIPRSFRGRDLLAQIFQHELNHLDGVIINSIGELVVR